MNAETQLAGWLIAARAVHFGACLLAFGAVAFEQWIAAPALHRHALASLAGWPRTVSRIVRLSLALALLSGAAWFVINAITMSGLSPGEALQPDVLRVVLTDTHFGKLWALRGILLATTLLALIAESATRPKVSDPSRASDRRLTSTSSVESSFRAGRAPGRAPGAKPQAAIRMSLLALTGALAGSLAWAGHGMQGKAPSWHLATDAVHILVGGLWPAGLLPFALLLKRLRRAEGLEKWGAIASLTRRLSAVCLSSVILLAGTGVINCLYLIGAPRDLVTTPYGKALSAKIAVFLAMVALGALNLLRWKPRLRAAGDDPRVAHAIARLRLNVLIELALGVLILALVGLLGLLPPTIDAVSHLHHH